ncbi:MAG: dTDP-4-dehydrorhamnose reductase [Chitinophagaceae bacterium]|nr:dTDP-4-dehydrorhamnose reductase [Chitinophagaceae bacterium]
MKKKKIIVVGANGQLGSEINVLSPLYPQYEFVFLSEANLSILDFDAVRSVFKVTKPDYLINCAAYTAVDKAEADREIALKVNAEAVSYIAVLCEEYKTGFIHISTDYVFDGNASVPYKPDDITNPQSVYGDTKLAGERLAFRNNPSTILIRTAWVYSEFGHNFVKTMIRLMKEREEIKVVNDQVGTPTYAADLADAIMKIISSEKWVPGIYHFSNAGIISWYDFALAIKEETGSNCRVLPVPTSQYPTSAKRPAFSVLDTSKISVTYSLQITNWRGSLLKCLKRLTTLLPQHED